MLHGSALAGVLAVGALVLLAGSWGAIGARAVSGPRSATHAPVFPTEIRHVVVIAMENRELDQVVGVAPFQTYLYDHFAAATDFYALCHGVADYLSITSGVRSGCGSSSYRVYNTSSLGPLAVRSGETWIAYDQSMPTSCATQDNGSYVVRHNPFVWYGPVVDRPTSCGRLDVPLGSWNVSNGFLRNYTFVTPNMTNDCHDANESVCDAWLKSFLNPVLNDTGRMDSTVFLIWYDEGTTNAGYTARVTGGHTYLVAVCGLCVGHNFTANGTDLSVATTTEWLLGLPSLGHQDNATVYPPMRSLFG